MRKGAIESSSVSLDPLVEFTQSKDIALRNRIELEPRTGGVELFN